MTAGFYLPVADLRRIVRAVAPAASTDECRPLLCGIVIKVDAAGIASFTACDSYRLHRATPATAIETEPFTAIVPAAWLVHWSKVKWPRDAWVSMRIRSGRVSLSVADDQRSTKTITGEYPDVDKLLELAPRKSGESSAFNPRYLRAAFDAAHVWSDIAPLRTKSINVLKPCMFSVIDKTVGKLELLLMPVRIPPPPSEEAA